jgi:hypothetical protein
MRPERQAEPSKAPVEGKGEEIGGLYESEIHGYLIDREKARIGCCFCALMSLSDPSALTRPIFSPRQQEFQRCGSHSRQASGGGNQRGRSPPG